LSEDGDTIAGRFDYAEHKRRLEAEAERERAARTAFLQKFLRGPDLISWVAPKDGVVPDEVLSEHLAQLQNGVRYALESAYKSDGWVMEKFAATNAATRMIRASLALAKELKTSKSKTVRGGRRTKGAQD